MLQGYKRPQRPTAKTYPSWRPSSQKRGGREAWIRRVRTTRRRANHPLSLAVLRRGIRTRHTQLDTPREEERTGGGVVDLTPVVTLDGLNGEAELSGHPGEEVEEGGKGLRLGAQRKSPRVVREIIDHHQIVLIARKAKYMRGPQVTVNKIKCMHRMRRRRRKKS